MAPQGEGFVVFAALDSRRAAERMVASLGHEFRTVARKGHASALVVSRNPDGSLKVTESRVLTGSALVAALMGASVAWMAGLLGVLSALRGAKSTAEAARVRRGHVASDDQPAHAILAEAGSHSAVVLIRCQDEELWRKVSSSAAERASLSWHGSLRQFLAALDPGSKHDWVRTAIGAKASDSRRGTAPGSESPSTQT